MVMIVAARSLGIAVSDATFLYGESRGGIMTFLALRNGLPVRAAATFGAITDLEAFLGVDDHAAALGPEIWPDFATNRALITEGRSAQRWPERIRAPILLMHGADDTQVDVSHKLRRPHPLSQSCRTRSHGDCVLQPVPVPRVGMVIVADSSRTPSGRSRACEPRTQGRLPECQRPIGVL